MNKRAIPACMRGGTSKGLFFYREEEMFCQCELAYRSNLIVRFFPE